MRHQIEEVVVALSSGKKQAFWVAIQPFAQDRVVAGGNGVSRHRLTLPQRTLRLSVGHPASRTAIDQEGDGEQHHRETGAGKRAGPGEELAIFALVETVQDDDRPLEWPWPPGEHQWQSESHVL